MLCFRKHYILDALCNDTKQESVFNAVTGKVRPEEPPQGAVAAVASVPSTSSSAPNDALHNYTDVEMQSMISSVQDLLPHLGPGYVEACLQYYKFKVNDMLHYTH